jgi:hypothetical protein
MAAEALIDDPMQRLMQDEELCSGAREKRGLRTVNVPNVLTRSHTSSPPTSCEELRTVALGGVPHELPWLLIARHMRRNKLGADVHAAKTFGS